MALFKAEDALVKESDSDNSDAFEDAIDPFLTELDAPDKEVDDAPDKEEVEETK